MKQAYPLQYPPSAYWEITDSCNHRCIHCFNYWREEQAPFNRKTDFTQTVNRLLSLKPVRVVITGGEPLLVFPQLKEAIILLRQHQIAVSVNTNASLVTDEIASFLRTYDISVFVSFPSAVKHEFNKITSTPNGYRQVLHGLDRLHRHGVSILCNMVVSTVNLDSVYNTARFLKRKYGFGVIHITRVSVPMNAGARFAPFALSQAGMASYAQQCSRIRNELMMQVRASTVYTPCSLLTQEAYSLFAFENSCEAGISSYVIGPSGQVRACVRDTKEYGDFLSEDFSVIWNRMQEWRDGSLIPKECTDCTVRGSCRGGCRVDGAVKAGCRNLPDSYSEPVWKSDVFEKPEEPMPCWSENAAFRVDEQVQYMEEEFGTRVSCGSNYLYCTKEFAAYLRHNPTFTLQHFMQENAAALEETVGVVYSLYRQRIVQQLPDAVKPS